MGNVHVTQQKHLSGAGFTATFPRDLEFWYAVMQQDSALELHSALFTLFDCLTPLDRITFTPLEPCSPSAQTRCLLLTLEVHVPIVHPNPHTSSPSSGRFSAVGIRLSECTKPARALLRCRT
jgi:hypothetical protein